MFIRTRPVSSSPVRAHGPFLHPKSTNLLSAASSPLPIFFSVCSAISLSSNFTFHLDISQPVTDSHSTPAPPHRPTARPALHPSLRCPEASGQEPGWLYKRSWRGDHSLLSARLMFTWWHDRPFKRQIGCVCVCVCVHVQRSVFFSGR